jgi:FkbM family methyltransferase
MLEADEITVVLDIGANEGQYGRTLRASGWLGRIVSFEPLSDASRVLADWASGDASWESRRLALGAHAGPVELNVSASSMSSSVLPMHSNHERLAPGTGYIETETVPCVPLDDIFDEYVGADDAVALKLDVQGYEAEVLAGASRSLGRVTMIEIEVNLVELYIGQPTPAQIVTGLADADFTLCGIDPEHIDAATGRASWVNATFRRH